MPTPLVNLFHVVCTKYTYIIQQSLVFSASGSQQFKITLNTDTSGLRRVPEKNIIANRVEKNNKSKSEFFI